MTHEEAADLMETRLDGSSPNGSSLNGSSRDGHGASQNSPRVVPEASLASLKSLEDTECGRLVTMIEELELPTTRRRFEPGDVVYRGHEPEDGLYILTGGVLRIGDLLPGGKTFTTRMLAVSDTFGRLNPTETGEMLATPSTAAAAYNGHGGYVGYVEASAEALTDSEILKVPRVLLRRALRLSPEAALSLATLTERRLAEQEKLVRILSLRRTESRLAGLLLLLAEKFAADDGRDGKAAEDGEAGKDGEASPRIMLRLTHQDLSDMIAVTRESVTKAMADLQDQKLIRYERGLIVLSDAVKLRLRAVSG